MLGCDDLVETFDYGDQFFRRHSADSLPETLDREGANLADLHPGSFRKSAARQLEGQGKPRRLRLARHGHSDDGAGALVEDVVADDEDRAAASLFPTLRRVE